MWGFKPSVTRGVVDGLPAIPPPTTHSSSARAAARLLCSSRERKGTSGSRDLRASLFGLLAAFHGKK
jgi:hypothetical protein